MLIPSRLFPTSMQEELILESQMHKIQKIQKIAAQKLKFARVFIVIDDIVAGFVTDRRLETISTITVNSLINQLLRI